MIPPSQQHLIVPGLVAARHAAVSYAPEVIADSTGKWCGNGLRFATYEEAESNVNDLMMRWFAVQAVRVVESSDPVNYRYENHSLVRVEV